MLVEKSNFKDDKNKMNNSDYIIRRHINISDVFKCKQKQCQNSVSYNQS